MKKGAVAVLSALVGAAAGAAGSSYFGSKQVEKKAERNLYFQKVKNILAPRLEEAKVNYDIEVRFKHLYSIWRKMQNIHQNSRYFLCILHKF